MTDLITRVRTALGSDWNFDRSPWEGLMRLFEVDADAFYLLACEEPDGQGDSLVQPLNSLAHRVRKAIRASYRLVPPANGEGQVVTANDRMTVPADLFPRVRQFLMELDDKGVSQKPGKDYEGEAVSEAEVQFKLGSPAEQAQVQERVQARKQARPKVFRVSQQDLDSLSSQPAYVSHNLFKCARKVVLAPTAIYQGLNRGEKAPRRLAEGYAICGKPNKACDNSGCLLPPPSGMVFMVYADKDRFVFDWDWVQEDEHAPGHPLDGALRFGNPVPVDSEMVLDLPVKLPAGAFDSTVATYSESGDCIFCYMTDACGFAERINSDLTVFRQFGNRQSVTGFKVKNVQRILEEDRSIVIDDAPDLIVSVDAALLATLKGHKDTEVNVYTVIIQALYRTSGGPPKVRVPMHRRSASQFADV